MTSSRIGRVALVCLAADGSMSGHELMGRVAFEMDVAGLGHAEVAVGSRIRQNAGIPHSGECGDLGIEN